jgi:hypothetical protein
MHSRDFTTEFTENTKLRRKKANLTFSFGGFARRKRHRREVLLLCSLWPSVFSVANLL